MERDRSIDIAKGIAIILVLIGHNPFTPQIMRGYLSSFHMPLFFLCSGMLFSIGKYNNFREFFVSRIKKLVIPYFCLTIMLWILIHVRHELLSLLTQNNPSMNVPLVKALKGILFAYRETDNYFSMWFLPALFLVQLVFYFIVKLARDKWWAYAITTVAALYASYFLFKFSNGFYWSADLVPLGISFFSVGYMLKHTKAADVNFYKLWLLPIAAVLSLGLFVLSYKFDFGQAFYGSELEKPLPTLALVLAGCWLVLIISKHIGSLRITEFFGRNSLIVYAFNNDFAVNSGYLCAVWLAAKTPRFDDPIAQWFVTFILGMLISAALVYIVNRFLPFTVGKGFRKKQAQAR